MSKKTINSNKKLKSKLKHYSALAASVVALDASGQVVYTNINDTTLVNNGDYFDIDLNSDGILEGKLELVDVTSSFSGINVDINAALVDSLNNASINVTSSTLSTSSSTTYVGAALNLNENINNNLNVWSSGSSTTSTTSSSSLNGILLGAEIIASIYSITSVQNIGEFPGTKDKFLGVKFTIGTSTHYGWLRLDMSADVDSVTIKDFAYESSPNTSILAGDTGVAVGLSKQTQSNKVDYFASNGKISINTKLPSNSVLTIYDLSGKLLQTEMIGPQNDVSVQGNLQGIYIVEIRNSTGVTRKKLWLESN